METLLEVAEVAYAIGPREVNQSWLAEVDALEARLMDHPFAIWEPPLLIHRFAPGVYMREIHMEAGTLVIGVRHNTEHFNVVMKGRASVFMEGRIHEIAAPCTFKSNVDVRKVLLIHEDMIWQTIHPTDETDIKTIEGRIFTYTQKYLQKKAERDVLMTETKEALQ